MPDPVEAREQQVEHRAEAFRMLDIAAARTLPGTVPGPSHLLAEAQVHASLAIAEQLERLNDQIAGIAGGGLRVVS